MDRVYAVLGAIAAAIDRIPAATWSTPIGVLVGGVITYLMQRLNHRHQRQKEENEKRKRELALSISIMLKVAKIYSSITHIRRQLDLSEALAAQHGIEGELPCQIVQPIVGKTPDVLFSDDERLFIVTALRTDYVTVLEMADIHNDLTTIVEIYSKSRIDLAGSLPGVPIGGYFATTEIPKAEFERLNPRMLNIQSLVSPMVPAADRIANRPWPCSSLSATCAGRNFPTRYRRSSLTSAISN
jgi:hypothetical protein